MNDLTVDALNCPNCGAGVASDSTECPFCRSRLKTIACPTCFKLMFIGSQFCDHCGAKAIHASVEDRDDLGECPRCKIRLDLLQIGGIELDECQKCGGMWADAETFQKICADREEQSAVLGFIGNKETSFEPLAGVNYVPCPICKQLMNRSNFARSSGVIIDTCKQHGVWFDAEELPKIIAFIQKGGMELARQKERIEIENQRNALRAEQRGQTVDEQRFGLYEPLDGDDEPGIKGFISKLFD